MAGAPGPESWGLRTSPVRVHGLHHHADLQALPSKPAVIGSMTSALYVPHVMDFPGLQRTTDRPASGTTRDGRHH